VRDTVGGRADLRFTVRDDDIFTLVPRLQRQLLQRCTEELLAYGFVGENGSGMKSSKEFPCGEIGEIEESVVPIFKVPFGGEKDRPPLVCSASFTVNTTQFRVSLAKASGTANFTFGIQRADGGPMHLLHLCDRMGSPTDNDPLGLYGEVHEVGGMSFLMLAFLDESPKILRLAVIDASSRRVFQLGVLPTEREMQQDAAPSPSTARQEVFATYQSIFTAGPATPMVSKGMSSRPSTRDGDATQASRSIYRGCRKLASGQPVMLTVLRELLADGPKSPVRFRVRMYHPVTSRESSIFLQNPLLDQILRSCDLGNSKTATAEVVDAKTKDLATRIVSCVYIHPDGREIEFRGKEPGHQKP